MSAYYTYIKYLIYLYLGTFWHLLFILSFILNFQNPLFAQERKKLESDRSNLIEQIVDTSKLIKENKIKKASTLGSKGISNCEDNSCASAWRSELNSRMT